jgi:hypothetical protein
MQLRTEGNKLPETILNIQAQYSVLKQWRAKTEKLDILHYFFREIIAVSLPMSIFQ